MILFHGTSALFIDNIIRNGLGGGNPIREWRVVEFCKAVAELCELHNLQPQKEIDFLMFKRIANQSNGGLSSNNFQHGQTYLSSSREKAISYAKSNEFGSELLSYAIKYFREFSEMKLANRQLIQSELEEKYPSVFLNTISKPSPLLIAAKNITIDSLLTENGDRVNADVENQSIANSDWINFRLIKPVAAKDLEIWQIDGKNLIKIESDGNNQVINE